MDPVQFQPNPPPLPEDGDECSVHYLSCKIILEEISAFNKSPEEMLRDEGWTAAVIFMAWHLILPAHGQAGEWDNENRVILGKMFANSLENSFLFGSIVEPILSNGCITGVRNDSKAIGAASYYAAKFLGLVHELYMIGPNASPQDISYERRHDYERALVIWVEWHVFSTCSRVQRDLFKDYILKTGIPRMYSKELQGDWWAKRCRENYGYMAEEVTGWRVTDAKAEDLWLENLIRRILAQQPVQP